MKKIARLSMLSLGLTLLLTSAFSQETTANKPTASNCATARALVSSDIPPAEAKNSNIPTLFPNPTSGKVTIGFNLSCNDNVSIKIYNADGLLVDDLGTRAFTGGYQQVVYYISGKKTSWYNVLVKGKGMEKILQLFYQKS